MDKAKELAILEKALGQAAHRAVSGEAPDFVLETQGGLVGFEITEFYATQADAKLSKNTGYMLDLLDGKAKIHRRDQGAFAVDQAEIIDRDGKTLFTAMAIKRDVLPLPRLVDRLLDVIRDKESKYPAYATRCSQVDLVILDSDGQFIGKNAEEALPKICEYLPFDRLRQSPFREVTLVTRSWANQEFLVSLKAMVFASDLAAFWHLYDDQPQERSSDETFKLLFAYLLALGYQTVVLEDRKDDIVGMLYGAWEVNYSDDGAAFRNWTVPHRPYRGNALINMRETLSEDILAEGRSVVTARASLIASLPVYLPAHGADDREPKGSEAPA